MVITESKKNIYQNIIATQNYIFLEPLKEKIALYVFDNVKDDDY